VRQIFASEDAFAALLADGSVVTWGHPRYGGSVLSERVLEELAAGGVRHVFATTKAFAALKEDGSVVAWGQADRGGDSDSQQPEWERSCSSFSSAQVQAQLAPLAAGGVQHICATEWAFAALKSDGSVVTWGHRGRGGDSSSAGAGAGVQEQLRCDVQYLYSTSGAFAAVKTDGSIVTWGDPERGGRMPVRQSRYRPPDRAIAKAPARAPAFLGRPGLPFSSSARPFAPAPETLVVRQTERQTDRQMTGRPYTLF
jgi:hypothetical protein